MHNRIVPILISTFVLLIKIQSYTTFELVMNQSTSRIQMAQYNDTIRGCKGLQCFIFNFTNNTVAYQIQSANISYAACNFTDYLMIQKKMQKLWHFQICNMTGNTASSVILKFQNLMVGMKFQQTFPYFGSFSDYDFPWFYSKASNISVLPWYFLSAYQKIYFTGTQKIILNGFKQNKGFQKDKNPQKNILYKLQGYPNDGFQYMHDNNFTVGIIQACIAANGKYVVYITNRSTFEIYNVSTLLIEYENKLPTNNSNIIYLYKINQTHILVGVGGNNPQIRLYDLRIIDFIVQFIFPTQLCTNFTFNSLLTSYWYNNTLVYHNSDQPNKFVVVNGLDIKKVYKSVYIYRNSYEPQYCYAPHSIQQNNSCVLCGESCLTCNGVNPQICTTCSFGFYLNQNFTCQPTKTLIFALNTLSILVITNIVQFHKIILNLLDNLWLYSYHKFTYGTITKGILILIRKANQWKFVPYSLSSIMISIIPHFNDTNKEQALPLMYKHLSQSRPNFQFIIHDVYIYGVAITILVFILFKVLHGIFKNTFIGQTFFGKINTNWIVVIWILSPRLSFIAFHFFAEMAVPSFLFVPQKIIAIIAICIFFLVFFFALAFYPIMKQYYKDSDILMSFCIYFRNIPLTYRYLSVFNFTVIMQGSISAFLYNLPEVQKFLILMCIVIKLLNVIVHYKIYEIVGNFFICLFSNVSLLMLIVVLILDQYKCPQLFDVKISIVQFISIIMLGIFVTLQIFSSILITLIRFGRFLLIQIQQHKKLSGFMKKFAQLMKEEQQINKEIRRMDKSQSFYQHLSRNNINYLDKNGIKQNKVSYKINQRNRVIDLVKSQVKIKQAVNKYLNSQNKLKFKTTHQLQSNFGQSESVQITPQNQKCKSQINNSNLNNAQQRKLKQK